MTNFCVHELSVCALWNEFVHEGGTLQSMVVFPGLQRAGYMEGCPRRLELHKLDHGNVEHAVLVFPGR